MKFKLTKEITLPILASVNGIIEASKKQTMPILANTLVNIENGEISMIGSDLEIEIKASQKLPADLISTDFDVSFTVESNKFLSIAKALPDSKKDIELSIDENNDKLTLKCGSSKYNLQTIPADDFPIISNRRTTSYEEDESELTEEELKAKQPAFVKIKMKELRHMLNRVNYAMAVADMRAYLNGVFFEFTEDKLNIVATDGHRLGFISTDQINGENQNDKTFILPRKAVLELIKLIPANVDETQLVELTIEQNSVKFKLALQKSEDEIVNIDFTTKLIDGRFPDYKRVIPQNLEKSVLIDRLSLVKSLQRASILADKRFNGCKFNFYNNILEVVAKNSEQEEANEQIDIDLEIGENEGNNGLIDIGFNIKYLLDALTNIDASEVEFKFTGQNAPGMFFIPSDESFKYVVMPMRL